MIKHNGFSDNREFDIKKEENCMTIFVQTDLCVRQMTVIIEKTTPMARPRSTLSITTDSQVTTQTIYTKTGSQDVTISNRSLSVQNVVNSSQAITVKQEEGRVCAYNPRQCWRNVCSRKLSSYRYVHHQILVTGISISYHLKFKI